MTYVEQGPGALDYLPYRYGTSKLLFRGPWRDLEAPYVAFIGGTQTFGKFIEQPYPLKVEHLTGVTSANLGQINAGLDVFVNEPAVHDITGNARVTVVEVLGAANSSNLFYAVHPRRNDRFLRASQQLKQLYPDVDFTQFNFTQHMLQHLSKTDAERFKLVRRTLQRLWMRRMRQLIGKLGEVVVLLGLNPCDNDADATNPALRGPAFVTDSMLERLAPLIDAYVEISSDVAGSGRDARGMIFSSLQEEAAKSLRGPEFHTAVAGALRPVLDRLM